MATRMRQRRGTASQWTSANPILGSGEIGWESDTNKFKIGDGTNHWADLPYFVDQDSISTSLGDYVETSTLEQPNGVATLDSNAKLKTSQLPDVALVTVHAVADQAARLALSVEPGDIAIQTDNGQTYVLSASPASTNANWTAITVADPFPTKDTDDLAEGTTNKYFTNQRALDATSAAYEPAGSVSIHSSDTTNVHGIADTSVLALTSDVNNALSLKQDKVTGVSDTEIGYLDGVTSAIQTQINSKANLSGATFTGAVTVETDLTVDGNLTVSGTTTTVNTQDLVVADPLIYMGEGNTGNLVDLGIVSSFNDGTYQHSGLVRDASDGKWKLFKGVTDEPTTVVNFAQGSLDSLAVGALEATSITVGSVSNTEFGYLDGVTSAIQTQINGKISASSSDTLTNKTISGSSNTITNIGNSSLTNSSITINGASVSLGGTVTISGESFSPFMMMGA